MKRWIHSSTRLPDFNKEVLIYAEGYDQSVDSLNIITTDCNSTEYQFCNVGRIDNEFWWMELPPIPKQEKE